VDKNIKLKIGHALVLRTCNADMTSHGKFKWPESGCVFAPDWDPKPECGNGLHGLLHGCGDGGLLNWDDDAKWMAVSVKADTIVELNGKVKFPKAEVLAVGTRAAIIDIFMAQYPDKPIVSGTATAGYRGTATAGVRGTIAVTFWDDNADRYRIKVGYIGEDGLLPNVAYRLNDKHEFEPVAEATDGARR
jgi:hypothetical protein